MRKIGGVLIFLSFLFILNNFSCAKEKEENKKRIKYYSYSKGLKEAKKTKKYILIYFHSKRCPWCRILEKDLEENEKIKEYLAQNFVMMKVDADTDIEVGIKYRIRGVPTIWVLEPDGSPIGPVPGYVPSEEFYQLLKYIKSGNYKKISFTEYQEKEGE